MEKGTFLRLLLNSAESAAVPQAYICVSSDSAMFLPPLSVTYFLRSEEWLFLQKSSF